MTSPAEEHIALFLKNGTSDKEYHVHLVKRDAGWAVDYQYGRRGSALRSGTKTKEPVTYEEAKKSYDSVVKGQLKDGYTPTESGEIYQSPVLEARFTGIVPQLLNPVPEDSVESFINDDSKVAQEKFDGERRLVRRDGATVEGINRNGLVVPLPEKIVDAICALNVKSIVFDSEHIGMQLAVFDALEIDGVSLRDLGFEERHEKVTKLLNDHPSDVWIPTPVAKTKAEKEILFDRIKAENGEGLVFKERNSKYTPGRPASGGTQQKFKFVESATVYVIKAHATKSSVFFAAKDDNGNEVELGKVTIPVNAKTPDVGAIIEVQYLYAYPGGSLFQPVYKGTRSDQDISNCLTSQLKYKAGTVEEVTPQKTKKLK